MKKFILLTTVILGFTFLASGQWQYISTPYFSDPSGNCDCYYNGEIASNSVIYWAHSIDCGIGSGYYSYYKIYKTTDGGENWNLKVTSNYDYTDIIDMSFISQDTGYIVRNEYSHSVIYRTANGMSTLEACNYTTPPIFHGSKMTSYNEIYYIDYAKNLYLLENDTFKLRYSFPTSLNVFYSIIEVTENQFIYLACKTYSGEPSSNNLILRSNDNGFSWDTSFYDSNAFIRAIKFVTDSTGIAVGDSGTIIKTSDAGQTWDIKLSGLANDLLSIDCSNSSSWFATGTSGLILISTDGGETWINVNSPTNNNLIKTKIPEENGIVFILSNNHIWKANIFDLVTNVELAEDAGKDFIIYPNPAKYHFTIVINSGEFKNVFIEIFNIFGRKVYSQNSTNEKEIINCGDFPSGVYYIKVAYDGRNSVQKLVIQ